jgi:hypothetical protein
MTRDFFDPESERHKVVLVDAASIDEARHLIIGCEVCSENAQMPFEMVLDYVTGCDPSVTDYILEVPVRCVTCGAKIDGKTLVELNL